MNWTKLVDSIAYLVSPTWGANRIASRRLFEAATESEHSFRNAYEGGESDYKRGASWMMSRLSTDAGLSEDLQAMRIRSRELSRNDFLGGAIDSRVDHSVGKGFTVQARVKPFPGASEDRVADINSQLEELWERVASNICRTRKRSLWQKTCLAARLIDEDGEAFVIMSATPVGSPIPLCIEVVDADRVETPPEKIADPRCRLGIQYGDNHEVTGYWVRTTHPHDDKEFEVAYDFVPADRVCHLFVEVAAGQSRGLPWMTRVLNRAKDGKDLAEAGIIASQVQACYAAFIKSASSPVARANGAKTGVTSSGERIQAIKPGSVQYIGTDDEVTFSSPANSNMAGSLNEYNNRTIAGGLNWPYEMLLKDWRGVSFAGGRIVLNAAKLSTQARQQLLIEGMLRPIWNEFVSQAVRFGLVNIDARRFLAMPYRYNRHSWTPPKWSYSLTPGEEVKAKLDAIDGNIETLSDVLAENQMDFEEVMKTRQKERAIEREYDIMPTKLTQVERPQGTATEAAQ